MNSALLMHNAALRKCKWANYGFTVEQEGDSYSLVFYVGANDCGGGSRSYRGEYPDARVGG